MFNNCVGCEDEAAENRVINLSEINRKVITTVVRASAIQAKGNIHGCNRCHYTEHLYHRLTNSQFWLYIYIRLLLIVNQNIFAIFYSFQQY